MIILEGHVEIGDPLIEEDFQIKVEGPLMEENTLIEDLLEEDILIRKGDPWKRRIPWWRTPDSDGGPPGDGGPPDLLVDKDHQTLKDHLGQ